MATGIGWTSHSALADAIATASLNSLANNGNALGAVVIDNQSSALREFEIAFDLYLASVDLSSQTTLAVYIWLIESLDGGTTYEDGGASVSPARRPDVIIPLRAVNGAQRVRGRCTLPPGNFKVLVGNRSGAALASSGNTLQYAVYSDEINN